MINKKILLIRTSISSISFFSLIGSYYIVKPIRKPLLLEYIGIDYLHFFYLIIPAVTLFAVFLYNYLVSIFSRIKFLRLINLSVIIILLTFSFLVSIISNNQLANKILSPEDSIFYTINNLLSFLPAFVAGLFFIFGNIYIILLVSFFWSLNDEIYSPENAKKYYSFISLGAQIGVIIGSIVAKNYVHTLGASYLLILGALGILLTWLTLEFVNQFDEKIETKKRSKLIKTGNIKDFKLLFSNPYARLIGILTVLSTFGDSIFDYQFINLMEQTISTKDNQIAFLAETYQYTGILNIVLCIFITPLLLRKFGPSLTIILYPLTLFLAGILILSNVSIFMLQVFAIILTSLLHSLYEVGREIFYVPTIKTIKYKIKALNDVFLYKIGATAGSTLISSYISILGVVSFMGLSWIMNLIVLVWIPLIIKTGKLYNKFAKEYGRVDVAE